MSNVGLLYVGAVLFINGLLLIGKVPKKSAALMNLFVGAMQAIFPTIILAQANDDPAVIFGASGLYLFSFTYLYVGLNALYDLPGEGLGWFSFFVALCALVFGTVHAVHLNDPLTAVMWYLWAVLWFLFFLVLGLHIDSLSIATGWFTLIIAHVSATIPAFLLLTGTFNSTVNNALLMAAAGILTLVFALFMGRLAARKAPAAALQDA